MVETLDILRYLRTFDCTYTYTYTIPMRNVKRNIFKELFIVPFLQNPVSSIAAYDTW